MNLWIRLAGKELLRNRRFSLFFVLNLSIGLVGFIALNAFNYSIDVHLKNNLKEILTADLAVYATRPLTTQEEDIINTVLGKNRQTSRQITFFSMISGKGISRLARIVAIDDAFPLYGRIQLERELPPALPAPGSETLNGPTATAWISRELALVLQVKKGDTLGIGARQFKVDAIVTATPTGAVTSLELAPVIHIGISRLEETGLMGFGSRINYARYDRLPPGADIGEKTKTLRRELSALFEGEPQINVYNSVDVNRNLGRVFGYFTGYLGLVAIVALFLAGIGTAYLFRGYLNGRLREIAILMSLGAGRLQTYLLLLCQVMLLGLAATGVSILLSFLVLPLFPEVMKGVVPPDFKTVVNPGSLGLAAFLGTLGSVIFCLPVFVRIHELKPVVLLQGLTRTAPTGGTTPGMRGAVKFFNGQQCLQWISFIPGGMAFWGLAMAQTRSIERGTLFLAGFVAVFGIMALIGRALLSLVKRCSHTHRIIPKIALRNLFRHKHASVSCFVTIAMGAFLINVIPQVKNGIQEEISQPRGLIVPGFFLFDIQPEQLAPLENFLRARQLKLTNASPLVQGRITTVNGVGFYERMDGGKTSLFSKLQPKEPIEKKSAPGGRFRRRTFTFSWREKLDASETLIKGPALNNAPWNFEGSRPFEISLEEGFAQRFHLEIGDIMEFDIQGIPLKGRVVNLRKVRWNSFQPNFFILFQKGVLADAPRTFLASIPQMPAPEKMPLQNAIIQQFPNISVLDVNQTVHQLMDITQRLTLSINFMAWLAILAGLVVLYSIVRHETRTRSWEINLLKVLGAGVSDIRKIILFEFGVLGSTAAFFGILLSLGVSYGISWFFFGRLWNFHPGYSLFSLGAISLISMGTALVATGQVMRQKPVGLLRSV